jgi:hypothetical protein
MQQRDQVLVPMARRGEPGALQDPEPVGVRVR